MVFVFGFAKNKHHITPSHANSQRARFCNFTNPVYYTIEGQLPTPAIWGLRLVKPAAARRANEGICAHGTFA